MSSNALFKFRRNTNSINAPTEEDDSASRDRASSSFRDRFSSATFFASFNKSKPSDNTDALSTQSSSFSFSFLNTNTNTTKDASPKRDYDSDADLYNEGSRSRAGSSFQDDNVQLDFPKIRLPNAPAMHQDDELDVPDIPITSDLDLYADHDTYGSDLDDDLDSSNAKDPRDTGIYYDKILRFLLLSMKLPPSDVASTLEHVQGLRKNTTSLLDENQTEFLHQVQNEVQNLFDHQVRCRAMSVFQRWGLRKVERKRYHMLKYSGVIGRQHAIIELVKAERQYASCLTNGYKAFYIPLSNLAATQGSSRGANFPDSQDFKAIFGNYEEIFQYHSEFLLVLEKSMENWPYAASNIGAILKKSVHALKIYEEYANNFQHSCDTLARFFENAKFTTFIQGSESKHNSDMPLQVCLSQPLDRTSHYERFIEMLLERTPKHHTDYADLSQAYDAMRRLTFSIQSKLEKSGTRAQVLDILRRMQDGHDQFSLESIFIREGELIACHESKLNHRHVFLFDDRIILVRSSTKTMYRFRNMYKISQIKIRDIPDQGNLKHVFEVILPTESFYLSAQSPEEKRSWIEELASVISERIANTVFGVPLENLLKKEGSQNVVPKFIHDAVENILSDGKNLVCR
eukprot:TRINITY_DN7783_c0_g1_i6.p1 TRINITY_DN7783_c0_g1~~TRINITY_DN7783_c0_g1_i6.p1  ORF type:complete len:629 (+),score=126.26 TRINITY_DN7783_c0_g1_i6:54-1940(+)